MVFLENTTKRDYRLNIKRQFERVRRLQTSQRTNIRDFPGDIVE